jgi:hypothetical protein
MKELSSYQDIKSWSHPCVYSHKEYLAENLSTLENQHLLIQLLLLFPFLAFSSKKDIRLTKKYRLDSVYDVEKLERALNFRLDEKVFNTQLKSIENIDGSTIDYQNFYSDLFIKLYKYFFIELVDSIYLKSEKDIGGKEIKYRQSISEFMEELDSNDDLKKSDTSPSWFEIKKNERKKELVNSFGFNADYQKQILTELKIHTINSKRARYFYATIENNISLPKTLTSAEKNSLLRPLFVEIVCKLCYPEVFNSDYTKRELNTKYRKFLTTYAKSNGSDQT